MERIERIDRIDRMIDNITTLFVFVMTFAVSFILSLAQSSETNLSGENLLIFLLGFWGSVICIAIRYVFLYRKAIVQNNIMKKILMFLSLILGNSIFLLILAGTLILSGFSIKYDVLSNYNACQIIMLVILLSQWLGNQLFSPHTA